MVSNLFAPVRLFADSCTSNFLGFIPWDHYLQHDSNCAVTGFHLLGANSSLLLILLAVLDDLFRAAGLLAVIFIIYAGAQFIFSNGMPDQAEKARTTAINALVGLGISLVAIAFVSFLGAQVGNGIGGTSGRLDLSVLPNPAGAADNGLIVTALSVAFGVLGAIAFLIIVIAGMQYIFSQGDPKATSQAKNTIIYALVGLVLAIVAQSIVSLAVQRAP